MDRREFVQLAAAFALCSSCAAANADTLLPGASPGEAAAPRPGAGFPLTIQVSPLPNWPAWTGVPETQAIAALRSTLDQMLAGGFTGLEYPFHLTPQLDRAVLDYARARAMYITYNHTFEKGGVENFGRTEPPLISVYSADYLPAVKNNLAPVVAEARQLPGLYNLFCYHDEPFHARVESFDKSDAAQQEFHKRYGYPMPADPAAARNSPKQWLDLINFQSDTFPAGWRQVYRLVKQALPGVKVVLTHDSHSAMGAGVDSNATVAVDDIFHWGADFADIFVFDIYPYMMFDYRYGEPGRYPVPRISQMHYAFMQMRNLTRTYDKQMGFWFGTYNRRWFRKFMSPQLQAESWAEAETCYTAVAQGADFLISGYEAPEDAQHWKVLSQGLEALQRVAPQLLDCPKMKASVCFIFPRTQYVQLQEEYWNVAIAYELFLRAFGELDCLHEEQVKDADLDGYKLLVLFDIKLLPSAVARRIAQFVAAGGTVIADCVPQFDELRRPMTAMNEMFGVQNAQTDHIRQSGVWIPSLINPHWMTPPAPGCGEQKTRGELLTGQVLGEPVAFPVLSPRACQVTTGEVLLEGYQDAPALVRKQSGKGQTFLFGFCMQDTAFESWRSGDTAGRNSLERLLAKLALSAGVRPHVSSSNPEIEVALRAGADRAWLFAINHEAEDENTQIRIADGRRAVLSIYNATEQRDMTFRRDGPEIVLTAVAPRERPQLMRLELRRGMRLEL